VLGPSLAGAQRAPAAAPSETPPPNRAQRVAPVLPETEIVRSPDSAPMPPPPATGVLETSFPAVQESMSKLPPFFRDTDLNVRFRSFYFNRQSDHRTATPAGPGGGWTPD